MVKKAFQHIILIGRAGIQGVSETLSSVVKFLQSKNIKLCVEESTAPLLKQKNIPQVPRDHLPADTDLIIVVGGDGSLLNAAHIALESDLPVLGINRGRLGFLTDIYPNELEKIGDVIEGHYQEEKRFLLTATIDHPKQQTKGIALNDIVINLGNTSQMIEFEIYINERFVCLQRADGIIVSTPTGSTAYALSGGGPIVHPSLAAVVLVPMFPHTLSSRPIVVEADTHIDIRISEKNLSSPFLSCDGQERVEILLGASIHIHKKANQLRLIHPEDYSYFATLREKLGWEKHATRKFYKD